jgi:hypothetical protein
MKTLKSIISISILATMVMTVAEAQADFGFGSADETNSAAAAPAAAGIKIGGELGVGAKLFFDEMDDIGAVSLGDLYSARLTLEASGSKADAMIKLKASQDIIENRPLDIVDEARLRITLGQLSIEGGLLKLTWGKADSQGPLDVLNPLDLRDLTVVDSMERKIARPMVRASLSLGQASNIEAVVLPGFQGYALATEGRWRPDQFDELNAKINFLIGIGATIPIGTTYETLAAALDTASLSHSQAGARLTTSLGSVDLGLQYFYGYLPMPAVKFSGSPLPSAVELVYNRYHQIGADFAAVIAGFNTRAELAANLTEDLKGEDPAVYNPSLAFSLGFDRDLFAGLNLNLQYAGSYRLNDDRIDRSALSFDIEKDSEVFSSTLTAVLMKSLFKDALDLELRALYEFDDKDFLILPSAVYAIGDAEIELSAGFFGGDEGGQMGQYAESSYISITMRYLF